MIKINLLPYRDEQRRQQLVLNGAVLGVGIGFVLLVCGVFYTIVSSSISDTEENIVRTEQEINALKPKLKEIEDFKAKQKELKEKIDVLDELKKNRSGPVHLMDELSLVLPEKLWLTGFKEESGLINIKGVGLNENTVADFMAALEASEYYKNVVLVEVKQILLADNNVQAFSLMCRRDKPASGGSKREG